MSPHAGPMTATDLTEPINTERARPIKPLPTDRISPQNQLNILRAWVSASAKGTRAATVNEVACLVSMAPSTVAMANPFFSSLGLIQRLAVGTYLPSEEVVVFAVQDMPSKLSRILRQAWFCRTLIPKLRNGPIHEEEGLLLLESAAASGREHRKALGFLLELLSLVGVIERSEGRLTLAVTEDSISLRPITDQSIAPCRVTIHVDSKDLTDWSADQITAFFHGLAELVTAK